MERQLKPDPIPITGKNKKAGKITKLKQQLEEAKQKENDLISSRSNLQDIVKDLQKELEERDKIIRDHDLASIAGSISGSFINSPMSSPYVISPEGGSPTSGFSPKDSPPLSSSFEDVFGNNDNRVLELNEKIIDLERKILDLEEDVRAKDELIRARTEAVTLLSADLSAKGKSALESLDETRSEMKNMQIKFAEEENKWRTLNSNLKIDYDAKNSELKNSVDSNERLNFEISELKNKIRTLTDKLEVTGEELMDLKSKNREDKYIHETDLEESRELIDNLRLKLKAAEEDKVSKMSEFKDELREALGDEGEMEKKIVQLQNVVLELEDEKGQLQLKIIEYEEITSGESKAKNQVKSLEDKLRHQTDSLEKHVQEITSLETDKADLTQGKTKSIFFTIIIIIIYKYL